MNLYEIVLSNTKIRNNMKLYEVASSSTKQYEAIRDSAIQYELKIAIEILVVVPIVIIVCSARNRALHRHKQSNMYWF